MTMITKGNKPVQPLSPEEVAGLHLRAAAKIGPAESHFPAVQEYDADGTMTGRVANFVAVEGTTDPDFENGEVSIDLFDGTNFLATRINLTVEMASWLSGALAKVVAEKRDLEIESGGEDRA
jgi:hypothetical protein